MQTSCEICKDLFQNSDDIVSIPCGHVFHSNCLSEWLRRSKTCPECRTYATRKKVSKLYLNMALNQDMEHLTNEVETANGKLIEKAIELETCKVKNMELQNCVIRYEMQVNELQKIHNNQENQLRKMQRLNSSQETQIIELQQMQYSEEIQVGNLQSDQEMEVRSLDQRVESFKDIETKWQELSQKVAAMTNNTGKVGTESYEAAKRMTTHCSAMKRALNKISSFMSETEELKKGFDFATRNITQESENLMRLRETSNDAEKDNAKQISEKENNKPSKKRKLS